MSEQVQVRARSSLRRDAVAYGVALAVDRLSGLLVLPLLTAIMDRSTFGLWNQVLAAFALLSNLLQLGFYHSIVRYVAGKPRAEASVVFHGMLAIVVLNCIAFLGVAAIAPGTLSWLLFATPVGASLIFVSSVFIVSECLFEFIVLAFLRADGRVGVAASYYVAKNVLRLGLLYQGALAGADIGGLFVRLALSNAVLAIAAYAIHIGPMVKFVVDGYRRQFWVEVLKFSGPIVVSTGFAWANSSLSRFLIVYLIGLAEVGVYAANYSVASIVTVISLVANFVVVPHLQSAWNQQDKERVRSLLQAVVEYYIYATVPVCIAIAIFYVPFASVLISRSYIEAPLLVWTLLAFMLLLGLEQLMTLTTFLDGSRFSVWTRGISLFVNLALNLLLLREFGIVAAAIAAAVSTLLVVVLNSIFLGRIIGFQFPWAKILPIIGAGLVMAMVCALGRYWFEPLGFLAAVVAAGTGLGAFLVVEAIRPNAITRRAITILMSMARR